MNIDIDEYETAPQSESDVYFRINGKLQGEFVVCYLAYEPELKTLWEILEKVRGRRFEKYQMKHSKNTK